MAKCRMLLQENEDLGKSMSSGRIAKLEGDIALQKRLIEEMKNSEKGRFLVLQFLPVIVGDIRARAFNGPFSGDHPGGPAPER